MGEKVTRKNIFLNILLALGAWGVCIVIALISVAPQTYDIVQGEISDRTITAPRDIVDEVATNRIIEEEITKVGPVYNIEPEISQQIIASIQEALVALEDARAYAQSIFEDRELKKQQEVEAQIAEIEEEQQDLLTVVGEVTEGEAEVTQAVSTPTPVPVPTPYEPVVFDPESTDWSSMLTEENITEIMALLPEYLTTEDMYEIISMSQEELLKFGEEVQSTVQSRVAEGVLSEELNSATNLILLELSAQLDLSAEQRQVYSQIISSSMQANKVFDEAATQAEKDLVAESVVPVTYKAGQNIVVQGEAVTQEQYELLRTLGLLSQETTSALPYLVVVIYISLIFMMYIVFLAVFNKPLLKDTKKIAIIAILTALAYVSTVITQIVTPYAYPTFLFIILGAVLLSPKNALIYSVFLSFLICITLGEGDLIGIESLFSLLVVLPGSFFAIYTLKDMRYRSRLIVAGLVAAVPGVVITLVTYMMRLVNANTLGFASAVMVVGGFLCGIISIGVLPLIENAFKLTTPTKLLELSDPTRTLLRRLTIEAPGTYHHSMLVANLADAACSAIGGFSLLARVGAYYHDVGKLENPMYFKENQYNNVNPHDELTPLESSVIIRRHVTYGVELLKKAGMPKEIISIAEQHHGNSSTGYFYAMALKADPETNEKDFKYDGIPPTTKEGAIIMLADVVEAAVRSMNSPSREEISAMVAKLIKGRYDEGQLDNAPLNRQDLKQIEAAFTNVFSGVYHKRIEYPQIKIHGANNEDSVI